MTGPTVILLFTISAGPVSGPSTAVKAPQAAIAPNPYWLDPSKICGPICLSFVDRHFGGGRAYAEIAALCPPGPEGTNLAQLQNAAQQLRYHTQPFRARLGQLTRLTRPALVRYVWAGDREVFDRGAVNDHFVVLLAWDGETKRFHVFDPPKSLSWVPYREVARHYAGIGLVVSKEPLPPLEELLAPAPRWPLAAAAAAWALFVGGLLWCRRRTRSGGPHSGPDGGSLVAIVALLLPAAACSSPAVGPQAISDTEFDAGDVPAGTVLKHVFRIGNPSDKLLRYERITST
jgi:hypothetical protein